MYYMQYAICNMQYAIYLFVYKIDLLSYTGDAEGADNLGLAQTKNTKKFKNYKKIFIKRSIRTYI